ncbi:MAG: DUF6491 family protein [Proteobacteria bacterium]|nr:DUF6491 family protein [Pseudomonadota bacterium]
MNLRSLFLVVVLIGGSVQAAPSPDADQQESESTNETQGDASVDGSVDNASADTEESSSKASTLPEEIQAILDTQAEYGKAERCINSSRVRSVTVLDDRHVSFQVSRDQYYLVQFEQRCPGLRLNAKISYETNGTNVCEWDYIRAIYEFGPGNYQLGPPCRIPGFQEVSKEQLMILRETLKPRKKD